jgi:hypothetical protein
MSHYTDIGFKVDDAKGVMDLFNEINSNEDIKRGTWDLDEEGNLVYVMYYIGNVRYNVELDLQNDQVNRICLGHDNERICKAMYGRKIKVNEDTGDFDTLVVDKDDIPFWFSCPNMPIFHIKQDEPEELDMKIASFANVIEIIDKQEEKKFFVDQDPIEEKKDRKLEFANECYISNFENDPCEAFVSGVIHSFKKETNILTGNEYYTINIDCLGLYFNVLVDPSMINYDDLEVGKVARGVFFNTVLLVADNHPDYF